MSEFQNLSNSNKVRAILATIHEPVDINHILEYAGVTDEDFEEGELAFIFNEVGIINGGLNQENNEPTFMYSPEIQQTILDTLEISLEETLRQIENVLKIIFENTFDYPLR